MADDTADEPADDVPAAGAKDTADDENKAAPAGDDMDDLFEDAPKAAPKRAAIERADEDSLDPTAEDEPMTEEGSVQVPPAQPQPVAAVPAPPAEPAAPANEMRLWTDNTGNYTVMARLVVVLDGKVRLQKESGRFTTVPLERLSKPDLAFVQNQPPTVASTTVPRSGEF